MGLKTKPARQPREGRNSFSRAASAPGSKTHPFKVFKPQRGDIGFPNQLLQTFRVVDGEVVKRPIV